VPSGRHRKSRTALSVRLGNAAVLISDFVITRFISQSNRPKNKMTLENIVCEYLKTARN
jgi:hypothetical protein